MEKYFIANTFGEFMKRSFTQNVEIFDETGTAYVLRNKFAGFSRKFFLCTPSGEKKAEIRRGWLLGPFSRWKISAEENRLSMKWKGTLKRDIFRLDNGWTCESDEKEGGRKYLVKEGEACLGTAVFEQKRMVLEVQSLTAFCVLLAAVIGQDW